MQKKTRRKSHSRQQTHLQHPRVADHTINKSNYKATTHRHSTMYTNHASMLCKIPRKLRQAGPVMSTPCPSPSHSTISFPPLNSIVTCTRVYTSVCNACVSVRLCMFVYVYVCVCMCVCVYVCVCMCVCVYVCVCVCVC
jgi:hypothetical protein